MELSDRVVVVTGATGGVGRTVTLRWLAQGARVVAVDRSAEHLQVLTNTFAATGTQTPENLTAAVADISTADGARSAFAAARDAYGKPADTLIHLVGGFAYGDFDADGGDEVWQKMLTLNVMTTVHMIRAATTGMRERGAGWIVAMGARAAMESSPKMAAYAASKAALVSLVKSVAAELRDDNIHVNAILPSTIDTPANRASMGEAAAATWVTPDDIADATLYLCSDQARSVYGATLELYAKA